jgi:hypothetical protein
MKSRVSEVRHVRDFVLYIRFSDGAEGEVDLAGELAGGVFEPLKDTAFFAQVQMHPELRTAVWPNGADFAPEFLRSRLRVDA